MGYIEAKKFTEKMLKREIDRGLESWVVDYVKSLIKKSMFFREISKNKDLSKDKRRIAYTMACREAVKGWGLLHAHSQIKRG